MKTFNNVAKLIKEKRKAHPEKLSQSDLSNLLGYKNGQFISNVERGLCCIPLKMLKNACRILNIEPDQLKDAMMKDHKENLEKFL